MALDLTGIENVEFYSGHYLDAVLEGDLKGLFDAWSSEEDEGGRKAPHKRLAPAAAAWQKARSAASGEPDASVRLHHARAFHAVLIEALGYTREPDTILLEDGTQVPVAARADQSAQPYLWIVEAPFAPNESTEALDTPLLPEQYPGLVPDELLKVIPESEAEGRAGERATWRELLDGPLFRLDAPPRWILFLAGDELILAERHKWAAGRLLRFDLAELFSRKSPRALKAFCALAHRDALAPDDGSCLHDQLEEKSHKHAFAVSGDLKHGVRRAVELLANEAVRYRREEQKRGVFDDPDLAEKLKDDCLTYMYRLLFLLYVEARSTELGVVPMKSDAYREGYSLESLRDLELVPLTTDKARNGLYIDATLKRLFRLVNEGFHYDPSRKDLYSSTEEEVLSVQPLRSPLFDDARFHVLRGVRFRNHVLQEIIRLLSLSAVKGRKGRGRISYAQLGISQLGAVYESLLSYSGFFVRHDEGVYEVASKKDVAEIEKSRGGKGGGSREDVAIYYVRATEAETDKYRDEEFVRDEQGRRVRHEKGTFIYALAGRSREKSASFYTPEVLTECVVKYALKELIEDESGAYKLGADEILGLTVCEPAMGSGAFLLEAIDQLADAYLKASQAEREELIPSDEYQRHKRRVKARLATNNCYGVDLNPVAVELAQVSLWLGSMAEDTKCPWFGLRLAAGNSLIGARREVFQSANVLRKGTKKEPNWLDLVPEAVSLYHGDESAKPVDDNWRVPKRPAGTIYHFLLPASGMAPFDKDKVIKEIAPDDVARIKAWRKEFTKPFSKADAARLEKLSDAVDRLWTQVVRERHLAVKETTDRIAVWPHVDGDAHETDDIQWGDQERVASALEEASSAYRRLKLVMDAWCSLWFWPIEKSELLPERQEWLASLELVLLGQANIPQLNLQGVLFGDLEAQAELPLGVPDPGATAPSFTGDGGLEYAADAGLAVATMEAPARSNRLGRLKGLQEAFAKQRRSGEAECLHANVDAILGESVWLRESDRVQAKLNFHHWELRFAEAYGERGGFDLVLGNPPWIKLQWNETGVLSEFEPLLGLRKLNAAQVAERRQGELSDATARSVYLDEFAEMEGSQTFLNEPANYPLLRGLQTNLYKCFLTILDSVLAPRGVLSMIHQKGLYDDPRGGELRRWLIGRLSAVLHFSNRKHAFPEVHHEKHFEVTTLAAAPSISPSFRLVSNLFHPSTLDRSLSHDGHGSVPGLKDEEGEFDLRGHRSRIIQVDEDKLALFASLYDPPGTDRLEARLPVVHSEEIVDVLRRFAEQPRKLGDLKDKYFATVMFDETGAKKDGTIKKETRYPKDVDEWILQGPHFYVGTPFNKTPNEGCSHNQDYTSIDLTAIPEDYLPRTNYVPACDPTEYTRRTPKWKGRPVTEFYRHVNRRMLSPTGERTLVSMVLPPGPAHVHTCVSASFDNLRLLILFEASCISLVTDFYLKSTGKGDLTTGGLALLPLPDCSTALEGAIGNRFVRLTCISQQWSQLWDAIDHEREVLVDTSDLRIQTANRLGSSWSDRRIFKTDLDRRQALVEIDALVAIAIGLDLSSLQSIYRVQFPVLQQYEREQQFDQHGRLVPTSSTSAGEDAVSLPKLADQLKEQAGFDHHKAYHPGSPETEELSRQPIKLKSKDAAVLGVSDRCTVGDLLKSTTVRYYDEERPEGYEVELVGIRYTDPGLQPRMERVYPTPWTRCNREDDYRQAWSEFERRFGTGGSPVDSHTTRIEEESSHA